MKLKTQVDDPVCGMMSAMLFSEKMQRKGIKISRPFSSVKIQCLVILIGELIQTTKLITFWAMYIR
jgi:hypothetical protein